MAGLIEKIAKTDVKIHIPKGTFIDSVPAFDEIDAKAFIFESKGNPVEYPEKGTLNYETRMLIAPLAGGKEPTVPGKVKFGGKTFDISNIRTLRSMKGDLLGYRIAL